MALALTAHTDIGLVTGTILSPWCNTPCNFTNVSLQVKHSNLSQWKSSNSGSSKGGSSWQPLSHELPSVSRQETYSTSPKTISLYGNSFHHQMKTPDDVFLMVTLFNIRSLLKISVRAVCRYSLCCSPLPILRYGERTLTLQELNKRHPSSAPGTLIMNPPHAQCFAPPATPSPQPLGVPGWSGYTHSKCRW